MTTFVSKETVTRLLKDVKQILKFPLTENGIYYVHDDTDMMKGYALIIGPSDTPYFGGNYFFELNYPADYPHSPPKVKYCTNGNNIRFNPNLYACGKVCISLLNTWRGEQWTSCQTISTVLLTLCSLLCSNPLLNEPGVDKKHNDMMNYTEIINFSNINIAICDIIEKKESVFLPFFENFYPFVKENFIQNYYKLLQIANTKNDEFKNQPVNFKTGYYSMNVTVDYNKLIKRLESYKETFQIM
jgi:ubiquitin-conjugating enzyme E2 Z